MFGVHSGVCFLLLGVKLDAIFTYGGSTLRVCTFGNPLEFTHGRHMCNLGDGHWSTPGMHGVAAPFATLGRGSLLLLIQLFPNHPIYMVGHTAMGAQWRVT